MIALHRIIYPLFCWSFFIGYGIEAANSKIGWIVLVTSIGMLAFPDSFYRHYIRGVEPVSRWDWAAFYLGSVASVIYFAMLVSILPGHSLYWGTGK